MNLVPAWIRNQAWIDAWWTDLIFIISPAYIISAVVMIFPAYFESANHLPLYLWAFLILGVDVAHVYATLFRTYWKPASVPVSQTVLKWTPLVCWLVGVILYALDGMLFWRFLTYLAVFHFIRQQYGFMAIYARKQPSIFNAWHWLDSVLIYLSMLYPLAFWHAQLPRNFNWFLEGDFLQGLPGYIVQWLELVYLVFLLLYLLKESLLSLRCQQWNLVKNLLILGTGLSWYIGIVQYNGDLAFTATNVLSHGIPYMALVWMQNRKAFHGTALTANHLPLLFRWYGISAFLICLWALAWLEEGLWDGFVWREHLALFPTFTVLPHHLSDWSMAILVPLLALPQSTHYILDGFIWRLKQQKEFVEGNA
jgi:hypothetical protein